MAHLSKKGPWFVARFTYQGREYKKSLKTKDRGDAQVVLHEVESRIHALLRGLKQVPPGIDPGDYIVWGEAAQDRKPPKPSAPSFEELAELYLAAHKELKAESTLDGETIHLNNIQACLGASAKRPVDQLRHRDLEAALRERLQSVRGATVNKERRTLVSLFKWAVQQEHLDASPAATLPLFKTDKERPPFRTLEEIEEMLQRGGLSDAEVEEVWECLYLTQEQIGEVLSLVKDRGREDFVHPMFAIIAYTGMRRGEMLRLQWRDVDFRRGVVTARSRKQSRQRKETLRDIELHPELEARAELRRIFDTHPGLWQRTGDLAAHAEENLIRLIAEGEFVLSEAIRRRAEQMRQDLRGPFPTPLEKLTVERVVATWLYLEYVETQVAKAEGEEGRVRLWLKRQEQAHRLHQAAVKALVTVRELLPSGGVEAVSSTSARTQGKVNPNRTVNRITAAAKSPRQPVTA